MSTIEWPATDLLMIKFLYELKSFGSMARGAFVRHGVSVRIGVACLAVRICIRCRHVLEDFLKMAGCAGDIPMFAGQCEVCCAIVVELDPRKRSCDVTEAALLIDLTLVVWVSVAGIASVVGHIFKLTGVVALVAVDNLMSSVERK